MKKLISLLLCMAVMISMVSMITVSAADEWTYIVHPATDDPNASFELTGDWSTSSKASTLDNGDSFKARYSTDTEATAKFAFNNVEAGTYQMNYFINSTQSTQSPFKMVLEYNNTTETVLWEYEAAGWALVKPLELNGGSFTLTVSYPDEGADNTKYIRAGALQLVPYTPILGEYYIKSTAANATTESFYLTGSWSTSSQSYDCDGEGWVKHLYTQEVGASATYNFKNHSIESGWYDIYFYNPYINAANDDAAAVTVAHNNTTTQLTMNTSQSVMPQKEWYKITSDPLYFAGGDESVTIAKVGGTYLRVGAIKIVKLDIEMDEEKELVSSPAYNDGALTIVTNGSSVETGTKTVYAVVAAYTDGENLLAGVKTTPVTITAGADDVVVPVALPTQSGTSYKLFILDSLTSAKPIINSFGF